jgi:hypothetical protein
VSSEDFDVAVSLDFESEHASGFLLSSPLLSLQSFFFTSDLILLSFPAVLVSSAATGLTVIAALAYLIEFSTQLQAISIGITSSVATISGDFV